MGRLCLLVPEEITITNDSNQKTYTRSGVVYHYAQLSLLQPAEKTVFDLLASQLPNMRMLDIGVGGGRTTQHFAKVVADYVGIDYSAAMIAACQKRFPALSKAVFEVCDVRDLSRFKDNSFDFVLFSFNGIDHASHADRLAVFREILRVGKPGGYFFFSSHNLQGLEQAFSIKNQLSLNPISSYVNLVMLALLRFLNRPLTVKQLKASTYAIVRDESHNFSLKTYYIRPQAQIKQLLRDFGEVKVYSWRSGLEITDEDTLAANSDMWLYYLCAFQ